MRNLLKDDKLQHALDRDGYVSVPLLSDNQLEDLRSFYREIHPTNEAPDKIDGIHMTTWCKNHEYKLKVRDFQKTLFRNPSETYFQNFRIVNNVFIVKDPGNHTTFKVHQDWSCVDETKYQSLNVWMPLYDVTEETGALWILKGSHKTKRKIRGAGYLFPDYSPFFSDLEKKASSIPLQAGHAIIFYLSTIHGSPANQGPNERIATCFTVLPEEAPMSIYYQREPGDDLELHRPSDDFVYEYNQLRTESITQPPTSNAWKNLPSFVNKPITTREIQEISGKRIGFSRWF